MELIVILIIGAPVVLVVWLIARAVGTGSRIEELNRRVDMLQARLDQVIAERRTRTDDPAKEKAAAFVATQPPPKTEEETIAPPRPIPEPAPVIVSPPPIPPPPPILPPLVSTPLPEPVAKPEAATAENFQSGEPAAPEAEPASTPPLPEKSSFEMRLGTFWLVRIGIVMLLAGFAFFANYAYHHVVPRLGPGGKISLLYLASGLLLGAGAWWQRQNVKDSLKNYAQVLFAGGLAAVYFTTYAAHHIPPLRVIESAVMDGTLLLVWAGVIAWIADHRKSEIMALFAVGLAFFTSVITRVGEFTLYSNLILTVAAVVFLVRNRWATLSFAGLVTSYTGYAFWRFLHEDGWRWATPDENLWLGAGFLACYWLVFTVATFLSRCEKLSGLNRAAFLTLNNGAFFALFLLTMIQVHSGGFWKLSLGFGMVLLALTLLAQKLLPAEPSAKNAYLTQGLLLVTLGFITKFSGLHLSLVLGAESVVLFVSGSQRRNNVLKFFAHAAAWLATGWCVASLNRFDEQGLWTGAGLGALLAFNAFWAHRMDAGKSESPLRAEPTAFTLLAFACWLATTWFNTSGADFPLVLAVEAVVLTFSFYLLCVREITLLGQFFLIFAQIAWFVYFQDHLPPWRNPLAIIVVTIGLSHWWQHQKALAVSRNIFVCYSLVFTLAAVGIALVWMHPLLSPPDWLALTSLLAVAVTVYGLVTRLWPLAICGQIFLGVSAWEFLRQLFGEKPEWYFPLAPLAALAGLSFATAAWFARKPDGKPEIRNPLLKLALGYRWLALAMSLIWVWQYIPERQRVWTYMLAAVAVFAVAIWRRTREALLAAVVYATVALSVLWMRENLEMDVWWPNLLSLFAVLVMQQILRRVAARLPVAEVNHGIMVFVAGVSLWRFLSCWVPTSGLFLTMSWAAFALLIFTAGMILRERFLRWFGLGVLAASIGRVVLVDVWKQETIYRVLTFMALGVALLVVGFIYNKYQDTIRKWL
ncbi:MAG TPA: DUF2339 domain-containing protein [Candidatus Sulfotelmatobacter sp.]|jgi:uncharacterized membrane protein|nr:DUF2339 domain-containing protein [Candidatus Sulfotelmatobacter sp.]